MQSNPNAKRQDAATTTTLAFSVPSYAASRCTGDIVSRYASACSCLVTDVSATVTAPTPSTTITVTSSISVTSTISPTLATTSVTVPGSTSTFTDYTGTLTTTTIVATQTFTSFYIKVDNGAKHNNDFLYEADSIPQDEEVRGLGFQTLLANGSIFNMGPDGSIKVAAGGKGLYAKTGQDGTYIFAMTAAKAATYGATLLKFNIQGDSLRITQDGYTRFGSIDDAPPTDHVILGKAGINFATYFATEITFIVVNNNN
ncbi:hypothetical protein ABW20_dc0105462 [Dactylellina cionopaga]|nr:hypothetical protein ABW20_dc0105462 [Dactylellina cionopaga]